MSAFRRIALGLLAIAVSGPAAGQDPFDDLEAARRRNRATSQQEREEFEAWKRRRQAEFASYKEKLRREFDRYRGIVEEERESETDRIAGRWDEPRLSSRKVWVEYSDDLRERRSVDFERGRIEIETLSPGPADLRSDGLRAKLGRLLREDRAAAFENDRMIRTIEIRSRRELELLETAALTPIPILIPYLTGEERVSDARVARIVEDMLERREEQRGTTRRGEALHRVTFPLAVFEPEMLPPDVPEAEPPPPPAPLEHAPSIGVVARLPAKARPVWPYVHRYARKLGIEPSLVLAVIETESNFNPQARSHVPAYGLMQIVPGSAGLDVTEVLFGRSRILGPRYLYNVEKNIEAGTTFLHLLLNRYLGGVRDRTSRLYCAIAGYNTGAGNVFRAFTGRRSADPAFDRINRLSPQQVYDRLVRDLPYAETRHYLPKVVRLMGKYERIERAAAAIERSGIRGHADTRPPGQWRAARCDRDSASRRGS